MDSRAQGENPECKWLFSAAGLFLPSEWLWKELLVCKVPVVRGQPMCRRYIWWPLWWPLTRHACPSPQAAASAQRSRSLWSDGAALVVAGQVPSLFSYGPEHIHHEGIHDVHSLLWETQAHVDLVQHPGEIAGEALNVLGGRQLWRPLWLQPRWPFGIFFAFLGSVLEGSASQSSVPSLPRSSSDSLDDGSSISDSPSPQLRGKYRVVSEGWCLAL